MWYRLQGHDRARRWCGPLQGLKVGVHYGCHYLAKQYGILDDGGYPTFHEEIVEILGGTPVFYKERQLCCGYCGGQGFHPQGRNRAAPPLQETDQRPRGRG